ncbi:MAG: hypothetical protein Q4C93_05510 [Clostridia bacterium]|nr:hypothetical protein [Clostridia bacterium]MDY2909398.1 hypothetical protein [Oscillospiraceae bacterium]
MKGNGTRYYVSGSNVFVRISAALMLLSALLRFLGYWGFWETKSQGFIIAQISLPIACNLLFAYMILRMGEKHFSLTFIPVLLGVVFFIIKATGFDSVLHTVLCIILYMLVAGIYFSTVFGIIGTKWLLLPLFGLPFLYHVFVDDLSTILGSSGAMTLEEWLPELSVLCIMLSLFFICFAMKEFPSGDNTQTQENDNEQNT